MTAPSKGRSSRSQRLAVLIPYVWLAAFFLVPFLIVLKISLSHAALAQPPYLPVFDLAVGLDGLKEFFAALSFENYSLIGSDPIYVLSYLKSLEIALVSTAILLLMGFPLAYGMARAPRTLRDVTAAFQRRGNRIHGSGDAGDFGGDGGGDLGIGGVNNI